MPIHIALLRAINVTGHGKLLMTDLRAMCEKLGFTGVRTYIQSGNVVFGSRGSANSAKTKLETALEKKLGKRHTAVIRSLDEMVDIEAANPFPQCEPKYTMVVLLDDAPPKDALRDWKIPGGELLHLRGREIFIGFPHGQGQSKLKVPFLNVGTGRNLNTVRALISMAREG